MRYSYEYKKKAVELYHQGEWPETPSDISAKEFRHQILKWVHISDSAGIEALRHKDSNKYWTANEKLALVNQVLAGNSNRSVAFAAGIDPALLYRWVKRYKLKGYKGLTTTQGRHAKDTDMKTSLESEPLTESEREELMRLRAENEYLKAENEVIKKEIALREKRWDERLKAKKHKSSKNSEKKDTR